MKKIRLIGFIAVFLMAIVTPSGIYGQTAAADKEAAKKEKERQELIKKLEAMQKQKAAEEAKVNAAGNAPTVGVEQTIAQYESYYEKNCKDANNKTSRCADAMFSLASGYYKDARDGFVKAQNDYEIAMSRWEKNPVGKKPIPPRPSYDKSLKTYEEAVVKYPDFTKAAEGYYQIGNIYLLDGNTEKSRAAFTTLTQKYQNSTRASAAHFRVAEICFSDVRDYACALENLNKIKDEHVTDDIKEMAHFRKAEIYYNRGDLDKAAELFGSYVDKCDRREYPKRELRGEALEYLAVSFSDMPTGADAAISYFKKIGSRSYEDTIIYKVGMKNYDHGQFDQCIVALKRAIEKYPLFIDAPRAQTNVINCLVIRKKNEEANVEREKLVAAYSAGSPWANANANKPIALASAAESIKNALSSIAIYNHALAQESKDPEGKKKYYTKAIDYYERVIRGYPDDKWPVYEYRYNVAEAYMSTGQFEKAAESYDFVASADLSKYPVYKSDIDTLGAEASDVEKAKAENTSKTSPVNISQSDAGFNAIVALDSVRQSEIKRGNLTPVQAYSLPATTKFINYIKSYQAKFPKSESASEVLYLAASVHFDGGNYKEAVAACQLLLSAYGKSDTSMFRRSTKLAADSYVKDKLYDLGIANYDTLIARTPKNSEDYVNYVDLAAAAIFQKADDLRTNKQVVPAVLEFKRIVSKYPTSQVADKGWFEAAVTYEQADSAVSAAEVFKELHVKFPASVLIEMSFVRSAENYVKAKKFADAGATMKLAAEVVKKPEFAVGAYSSASEYYKSANELNLAGDMFYEIYKKFPTDKQTPQALYNAGLIYEDALNYLKAIEVYNILGTKYTESEFAPSGYFSIGLCYEKMGDFQKMAAAFVDYSKKYTSNRDSQVKALVKAGQAYMDLKNEPEAKANFYLATQIFAKFKDSDALSAEDGAKAYFNMGEILRRDFEAIKLTGKTQKDIDAQAKKKTEAFKPVIDSYMSAVGLAVAEWAIRSIYSIGIAAKNYANDVLEQTLIGKSEVKLGTKVKILSETVQPIYDEAIGRFDKAIQLARENGIKADYVKEAELFLMQAWFLKGYAFEEAGTLLRNSEIPKGLDEEEEVAYIDALEEYYAQYAQGALPVYQYGIANATGLFVGKNGWSDSIQMHLGLLAAEFGLEDIPAASVDLDTEVAKARSEGRFVEVSAADAAKKTAESEHQQAISAIASIFSGNMDINQKIEVLASREANARRAIIEEETKIAKLKEKLGL
ncbi:MAG: tetratricopeptide repeat protein [Chitinispirillales bacterium]|nr:tetratricopeptide repeat protein [Chitinispirillales bacterium]